MTPKEAIQKECRCCMNDSNIQCVDEDCALRDKSLSHVKRIKNHCLSCIPSQSAHGVAGCCGVITNLEEPLCPLHSFRLGKNPNRIGREISKEIYV
jgi:hypothetical protein